MINAQEFLDPCIKLGYNFFTGTPCSYLKPFINYTIECPDLEFVDSVNEGDAIALAAGVAMTGRKTVVMFQNSGLGNAVNPLTSLTDTFRIPMMVIITYRGQPDGAPDEPQHELMGQILLQMLDTMKLKWAFFPNQSDQIASALAQADAYMQAENKPFVFVMKKDDVAPYSLKNAKVHKPFRYDCTHSVSFDRPYQDRCTRTEALASIQKYADSQTVVVATTGKTGRELYEIADLDNQLYMVGSMGCALAFGLGIALAKPKCKVIVIDGDGALLMRTGSMATVGAYRPSNLIHILLDNEAHDSTGGQSTVTSGVAFGAIAQGFGYPEVYSTDSLSQFEQILTQIGAGPTFIHFKIKLGSPDQLGRPGVKPYQVKERLMKFISGIS